MSNFKVVFFMIDTLSEKGCLNKNKVVLDLAALRFTQGQGF